MNQFLIQLIALVIVGSSALAGGVCTEWSQDKSVTCIMAGKDAMLFNRKCENPCFRDHLGRGNWGPNCDVETICSLYHPDIFVSECSWWHKSDGVVCKNPNTGNWEQKWERACTVGLTQEVCTNQDPNK